MAGLICNSAANARKVDYEGVRSVATAAKAAGVKHYVQVSSLGVTNPNHPLNRFGKVMDWKLKRSSVRPQWCALAHASMPIKHGGRFTKNTASCARRNCLRSTALPRSSTPWI